MAILDFQRPDKVSMTQDSETFGQFEFRPLEPGYAKTIGNPLRRVLLSSLEGHAIYAVKIEGVDHEFATIDGVIEDVTDIILNLKKIRLKSSGKGDEETVSIKVSGGEFTGKEIDKALKNFKVLNKDVSICRLTENTTLNITLYINKGRGYAPAEEHTEVDDLAVIMMDAIYTPIKNVKYYEEDYRVGQKTDFEKLVLEITTDGSIHPKQALVEAARILIQHYMLFSDEKLTIEEDVKSEEESFDEEALHMRQLLKKNLVELDLSVRALNCLQVAEVETVGDLVQLNKNDLLKYRNFGKKSLTELDELLSAMNLKFGMDISKYKLDK